MGGIGKLSRKRLSDNRIVACPDGAEIFLNSMTTIDPREQLETSENHYEKCLDDKVIAHEEEVLTAFP